MQAICKGLFAEPFVLWRLWLCRRLDDGFTCWLALRSLRCSGLWYLNRGNVIQEHIISFYHGFIRFLWNVCTGVRVYLVSCIL